MVLKNFNTPQRCCYGYGYRYTIASKSYTIPTLPRGTSEKDYLFHKQKLYGK
jgi:hypothetical protein